MRSRLRTFLVGFLLLWLPVQGFAAGGMGACHHNQQSGDQQAGHHGQQVADHNMQAMEMDHGCCHEHAMQSDQAGSDSQPAGRSHHAALCDDCSFCHLGSATYPLPASAMTPLPAAQPVFHPFVAAHPTSFIPEQPQRPPLAA